MTGKKLKIVRLFLQMSQREFAKLLGKDGLWCGRTIIRYESGESKIPAVVELLLEHIMKERGLTLNEVYTSAKDQVGLTQQLRKKRGRGRQRNLKRDRDHA